MKEIYPAHLSVRKHPKNLHDDDLNLFEHEFHRHINATYIKILKRIDVLNDTVFERHKLKFYPGLTYTHIDSLSYKQKIKKLKLFLGSYNQISKAIWITDNWSLCYFHWLTDALSRLVAAEDLINDHIVLLPKEYEKADFIKQSLEMLNIPYQFYQPDKRVFVRELILPSHTALTGSYNKVILHKIRAKFEIAKNSVPYRKIYISREKAAKRKIINENEVTSFLVSVGYEIHIFEDYDFKKQISLMQSSTHLIGLHGAGLTNMMFMSEKSTVLELRNEGDAKLNCYFSLASELGHNYYYLLNQGDSVDTHTVNITVDLEDLKRTIQQMN